MAGDDLTPQWLVTCLYNGSRSGAGRSVTLRVRTDDPMVAIRDGWMEATRKEGGQGICITGLSAVEIPSEERTVDGRG